jgi:WhiB family redox-sensing transcriptional regulator
VIPEPFDGWAADAACVGLDPAWFYVDDADDPAADPQRLHYGDLPWRDACYGCPVRADCLAHALLRGENFGVWGGLPPAARRHVAAFLVDGSVSWVQIASKWQPDPLSPGRDTLAA